MTMNVEIPFQDAIRFATALRKLWVEHQINDPVLRQLEQVLIGPPLQAALEKEER